MFVLLARRLLSLGAIVCPGQRVPKGLQGGCIGIDKHVRLFVFVAKRLALCLGRKGPRQSGHCLGPSRVELGLLGLFSSSLIQVALLLQHVDSWTLKSAHCRASRSLVLAFCQRG